MNYSDLKCNINNFVPLKGDNIIIEQIKLDDLLTLYNWSKNEIAGFFSCRPIIKRNETELIKFYTSSLESNNIYIFGLYNKINHDLLGKVTLFDYNLRNQSLEIGFFLIPKYRKKGYLSEALNLIFNILFLQMNINKVYAQTASFNDNCNKLLKSNNFNRDGILREHHELDGILYDDYIYSILKSEYKTKMTKC